jgi:predicted transposase YdaD
MAQDYDKIFREVFKDIFPALARKVLRIPTGTYKPLPVDLQYTSEREADQLWEVVPPQGEPFLLHCEIQTTNDKRMLSRMLLYHAFLHYQQQLPIRQFVIYVGKDPLNMEHQLQSERLSYSYQLVDLRSYPYELFLESGSSREVLLTILADFGGVAPELISEKIITKLEQLCEGKLELAQRALQLVRLAVLRNLGETVSHTANKMDITIDIIKEDALYGKVYQEGKQEGKEKAALNMLKKGMDVALISEITELPAERVVQLKQQLEADQ